jgi:hypothetical protein
MAAVDKLVCGFLTANISRVMAFDARGYIALVAGRLYCLRFEHDGPIAHSWQGHMSQLGWKSLDLPNFQIDLAISADQLKICPISRDQARTVRAGGESDENVKMQVAPLSWREAAIGTNSGQYLTRFQPILLRRSQDRVGFLQSQEKLAIRRLCRTPPQLR